MDLHHSLARPLWRDRRKKGQLMTSLDDVHHHSLAQPFQNRGSEREGIVKERAIYNVING